MYINTKSTHIHTFRQINSDAMNGFFQDASKIHFLLKYINDASD